MTNRLTAPGRLDVVEQVLSTDPFFKVRMQAAGSRTIRNRRNIPKHYSALTIELVDKLAQKGLDVVTMRRDEVIAKAFELGLRNETQLVA